MLAAEVLVRVPMVQTTRQATNQAEDRCALHMCGRTYRTRRRGEARPVAAAVGDDRLRGDNASKDSKIAEIESES